MKSQLLVSNKQISHLDENITEVHLEPFQASIMELSAKIVKNLLLFEFSAPRNQILLWELFTDIHLWTLLTVIAISKQTSSDYL